MLGDFKTLPTMKKCFLCFVLTAAITQSLASDGVAAAGTNILVRLVKVSYSPTELQYLVATFEPIRIDQMAGGGRETGSFPPLTLETNNGKKFTVSFIK